jgi:hypothetical protein
MDVPTDFDALAERLPDPGAVRERLEKAKRETAFLRKLLRLAIQAKRVNTPEPREVASCSP